LADIPGLIEGASDGKGLGHRFLRHIERARVLLMMLDLSPTAERPPAEQQAVLEAELAAYRPDLLARPRLVVGSRADVAGDVEFAGERLSAMTGQGLDTLIHSLADLVTEVRQAPRERPALVVHRPEPTDVAVVRADDGAWEVANRDVARVVNLNDLTNPDAVDYVHDRLKSMGVDRALTRAGVREGETVRIGRLEFDYEEG
jgi:GTP-binding protein